MTDAEVKAMTDKINKMNKKAKKKKAKKKLRKLLELGRSTTSAQDKKK